jgi:signal transduction histidine kinase
MTTLRRRLALRYGLIVAICLLMLAGLTWHEFVQEPHLFRELGIKEPPGSEFAELTEVVLYAGVPLIFLLGWWWVRQSLKPVDDLARGVERFHAANLAERLPRSFNGDEVDRLAAAFNSMATRLEQSFRQIHEFTLHASHELKTPLTVIRAQLDTTLARRDALPVGQREALENLLEEVGRLARIVDSLTLLTKADAGLITLETRPVALDELLREGAEDAEVLAQPHGIRVTTGVCEPLQTQGDRHRLRQVVLNLLDNAVKYNQPGGAVDLSLRREDDFAVLTVTNTGPGIPPELKPRVFDRFVRGESARAQSAEGCGLGLTICRWILEGHGGTIRLDSEPGRTTAVVVRLPLIKRDASDAGRARE